MALEDSMNALRFLINIPLEYRLEVNDEEEDDDVIAKNISQEILEYLSAKLTAIGGNVKTVYNPNILQTFKDTCEMNSDLFISSRIIIKPEKEYNWVAIQFFTEKTNMSLGIASCLAAHMGKIVNDSEENRPLFEKALFKEESCDLRREETVPSMILALCLGYNALSVYNTDKDFFLSQIVDSMLSSITDCLCPESLYDINLQEYVD